MSAGKINITAISNKICNIVYALMTLLVLSEFIEIKIIRLITVLFVLIVALLSNIEANVIMLFSFIPFFNLLNMQTGSTSMYYLLIIFFCVKYVLITKKHYKLNNKLIVSFLLLFYVVLDLCTAKITWYLLVLPLILTYREDFMIKKMREIIRAMSITTILSCICGYWLLLNNRSIYTMGIVYNDGVVTTRFAGLIGDSVVLGMMLNILIAANLILIQQEKNKLLITTLTILLSFFGLLTFSKAFIVVWGFVMLIFLMHIISKMIRKKSTIYKVVILMFGLYVGGIYGLNYIILHLDSGIISNYLVRFNSKDLLTGRTGIFQHNFNKWSSDLFTMLFGMSVDRYSEPYMMHSTQPITNAHNVYLETLCLFGLFSLMIVLFAMVFIIIRCCRLKAGFIQFLPFLVLLGYGFILHGHLDFNYYALISLSLLFSYPEIIKKLRNT